MTYTPIDLVMDTAREFDQEVDDLTADAILWEETGFPGFFMGDPEVTLRRQVARYFIGRVDVSGRTGTDQ